MNPKGPVSLVGLSDSTSTDFQSCRGVTPGFPADRVISAFESWHSFTYSSIHPFMHPSVVSFIPSTVFQWHVLCVEHTTKLFVSTDNPYLAQSRCSMNLTFLHSLTSCSRATPSHSSATPISDKKENPPNKTKQKNHHFLCHTQFLFPFWINLYPLLTNIKKSYTLLSQHLNFQN